MSKLTEKIHQIDVSAWTFLKGLLVVGGVWLLWYIRDILTLFFVALLLAALIDPFADWFERHKIPRALGVLVVYVVLAGILTLSFWVLVPPLVAQISALGNGFADSFGQARGYIEELVALAERYGIAQNLSDSVQSLQSAVAQGVSQVFSTLAGVVGGVATLVIMLVLTFYMVVEEADGKRMFRSLAPRKYQPYLIGLAGRMQDKLGAWLRGQLLLMLIIGVLTFVGLTIIGVDYALVLGLLAGLAEVVPYAGPILAAIPAVFLAFTVSPIKALMTLILYVAIQQLENNLIVPKIMQKSVGLNPIVSLFSMMVGFKLAGLVGAILAIPVATLASVLVRDVLGNDE